MVSANFGARRPALHRPMYVSGHVLAVSALIASALAIATDAHSAAPQRNPGVQAARARPSPASGAKRPYSVEDMLKLESVNNAMSDPTGRWLVWEQAPPYDSVKDYSGNDRPGTIGNRLMALDTKGGRSAPIELGAGDGADSRWLDSFSPDGRYLVYYRSTGGAYSMGVYDFETGKTQNFNAAPNIQPLAGHRSVWLSQHEFAFAAFQAGDQPIAALRSKTGSSLWRDWNTAWHGGLSVNEVSSHANGGGDQPLSGRLMKVDAASGTMTKVSEGRYASLAASHDGRYLAALRQFSKFQADPGVGNLDWLTSRSKLEIFDLTTGKMIDPMPRTDVFPQTLEWASDRNRLALFGWDVGKGVRSGLFHSVDPGSGEVRAISHTGLDLASERERGLIQKPERVVWIGDRLAMFARKLSEPRAQPAFTYRGETGAQIGNAPARPDWYLVDANGASENMTRSLPTPSQIPLSADGRSMTVLAGGQVWRVAPGADPVQLTKKADGQLSLTIEQAHETDHPPFARFASLISQEGDEQEAFSLDLENGRKLRARFPSPYSDFRAIAGESGVGLFATTGPNGTIVEARSNDGASRQVAVLNAQLKQVDQTRITTLNYAIDTAEGRRQVGACMILPPHYNPAKRYPVIVHIYPGVGARCNEPIHLRYSSLGSGTMDMHLLAARGYIVLEPNTSRFLTNSPPNPMGGMPSVVDASLDALIAQGYADPDQIGLIGMSQGGYASLWLATQMKRFKAIVSINGWSDMYSHRFDGIVHRRYFSDRLPFKGESMRYEANGIDSDFGTGVSVWDQPDAYVRNSPLFHAREITAPVMLIHSDMDFFNINQYDMMFTALYEQKKEARYLRYAGEGHTPSSPANLRDMWSNIFKWFDQYLVPTGK